MKKILTFLLLLCISVSAFCQGWIKIKVDEDFGGNAFDDYMYEYSNEAETYCISFCNDEIIVELNEPLEFYQSSKLMLVRVGFKFQPENPSGFLAPVWFPLWTPYSIFIMGQSGELLTDWIFNSGSVTLYFSITGENPIEVFIPKVDI